MILTKELVERADQIMHCTLARNSPTQFQAQSLSAFEKYVYINGIFIDTTTPIICNVSGAGVHNTINADGIDSGVAPVANTFYRVYLSTSSQVRLRNTSHKIGDYLSSSGNGKNWRCIGFVYLNGSVQIDSDINILSKGIFTQKFARTSDFIITSGSGFYNYLSALNVVVGKDMLLSVKSQTTHDTSTTVTFDDRLIINGTAVSNQGMDTNVPDSIRAFSGSYDLKFSAANHIGIIKQTNYTTGNLIVAGDVSGLKTFMIITRITL